MNQASFSSANCKWRPDEGYRFQLAFFREDLPIPSDKGFFSVPPFNLVLANEPDIKNIVLSKFLQRGFLPRIKPQSEDEHFFLKLFEFPKEVSPAMSSEKVLSRFLLTKVQNGEALQKYAAEAHNIIVKCGWINLASTDFSTQPFPQFLIPRSDAQDYFDSSLAFSSLYVVPDEDAKPGLPDDALIEHSRKGVSALWEELLEIYRQQASSEIETGDESSMFVDEVLYFCEC